MIDQSKLEEITEDPLKLFDWVNQIIFKDLNDSEVKAFLSKTRAEIKAEPKNEQYVRVFSYILLATKKANIPLAHQTLIDTIYKLTKDENLLKTLSDLYMEP